LPDELPGIGSGRAALAARRIEAEQATVSFLNGILKAQGFTHTFEFVDFFAVDVLFHVLLFCNTVLIILMV
jgi:hypothetical protein